jgi:hypothetical protein
MSSSIGAWFSSFVVGTATAKLRVTAVHICEFYCAGPDGRRANLNNQSARRLFASPKTLKFLLPQFGLLKETRSQRRVGGYWGLLAVRRAGASQTRAKARV